MKNKIAILLLLLSASFVVAQKAVVPPLKIYLTDAKSGKEVTEAKVLLENAESQTIEGLYDKKTKYYYFTDIPQGYTTVLVNHKRYNEKGYQNPGGLPKEVKLKLYKPSRIRIAGDSLTYYTEEKSKIMVELTRQFEDSLVLKNPSDTMSVRNYFSKHYPEVILHQEPMDEMDAKPLRYITKRDGTDFKRFNDKLLQRLSGDKNVYAIHALLLPANNKKTKALPNRTISNILEQRSKPQPKKDDKTLFSFTYKMVTADQQKKNLFSEVNMEVIEKAWPYNLCKIKSLACSPLGLADVLEVAVDSQYGYFQKGVYWY